MYKKYLHDIEINVKFNFFKKDFEMLTFFTEEFYAQQFYLRIRCNINLKSIIETIFQLNFYQIQTMIVDYFKKCYKDSNADREIISLIYEMNNFYQVFDTSTMIQNSINYDKIHRVRINSSVCKKIDDFNNCFIENDQLNDCSKKKLNEAKNVIREKLISRMMI